MEEFLILYHTEIGFRVWIGGCINNYNEFSSKWEGLVYVSSRKGMEFKKTVSLKNTYFCFSLYKAFFYLFNHSVQTSGPRSKINYISHDIKCFF